MTLRTDAQSPNSNANANAITTAHAPNAGPRIEPLWRWLALAAVFAVGAWQGYGFGARIAGPAAGPWLGVLTGLNMGVMAALVATSLGHWLAGGRRT